MASTSFFNGNLTSTPGAASKVDDSALVPANPGIGNVLAIVGVTFGGQPNTPLPFGDPTQLAGTLVSGELLTAMNKSFAPSNDEDVNAPATVYAVRVGQATQSTLVLNDYGGTPCIELTSSLYGLGANLLKAKVAAGSIKGVAITTQVGNTYYTQDNLARDAFTLQYSGPAASAQMTISDPNTVYLYAPAGEQVAAIDLTAFPTVAQLVDQISAVPGFAATVAPASMLAQALGGLDYVSGADVLTTPYTATANLQACIDWFNGATQGFCTATRAGLTAGHQPAPADWQFFMGGTAPAATYADWSAAINSLQAVDVQHVSVLSGDPAVHAMADAHVQYMSTVGKRERRAYIGPPLGTPMSAVPALVAALNSDRTLFCWPGYLDYDAAGNLVTLAPYQSAVLVAAGFAGMVPGNAMTNKTVTARGLEVIVRVPTDTDVLIQAGACVLKASATGFKVVRSVSTWLENNAYDKVEVSCGIALDYAVRSIRDDLEVLVGKKNGPLLGGRAVSRTDTICRQLQVPEPIGVGVLVGDADSPAYRNITAAVSGDSVTVSLQLSPAIPDNFIDVAVSAVPYSGTVTTAAA